MLRSKENKKSGLDEEHPLVKKLDEATRFSFIATCAITLRELYYDNEEDRSFCKHCLEKLLKHLKMPKQVENTAEALFEGQGCDSAGPFVESLLHDKTLQESGLVSLPQDLVSVALMEGAYDSRHRMLIRRIAEILEIPWNEIETYEKAIVLSLQQEEYELTDEEKKEKEQKALKSKIKRGVFIGLATVGGGVLLGVTGGLAAPLLAAGVGTIVGAGGAAVLGSTVGVAIIGSLFGVAGASLGGYKMNKRVGDIEEFDFETLTSESDMHLTITVSGWLTKKNPDCKSPWKNLRNSGEQYTLRYETKYLVEMGQGIDYLKTLAVNAAVSEALKFTVLSTILAAITWPAAILSASNVIDNPWSVCVTRTVAAGKQLAEVLLSRQQGKRPVTLIGYSLGARVVFYCLRELAGRKKSLGIVEDAIMLGAPVTANPKAWKMCAKVVSGRLVNGFSQEDWLLKFLYRTASAQIAIAGLQPIRLIDRKMVNVDFSKVVTGHTDYQDKLDYLLTLVGLKVEQQIAVGENDLVGLAGNVLKPTARVKGVKKKVRTSTIPVGVEETEPPGGGKSKSKVSSQTSDPEPSTDEYLQVFLVEDPANAGSEVAATTAGANSAYDTPFTGQDIMKDNIEESQHKKSIHRADTSVADEKDPNSECDASKTKPDVRESEYSPQSKRKDSSQRLETLIASQNVDKTNESVEALGGPAAGNSKKDEQENHQKTSERNNRVKDAETKSSEEVKLRKSTTDLLNNNQPNTMIRPGHTEEFLNPDTVSTTERHRESRGNLEVVDLAKQADNTSVPIAQRAVSDFNENVVKENVSNSAESWSSSAKKD